MRNIFFVLIPVFLFFSCHNTNIFEKKIDFLHLIWNYNNPLNAQFDINNATNAYDICLDVNYTRDYPFQNIYFKITDNFTGKDNSDIITINLFDKYGSPLGKAKGQGYDKKIVLRKGFVFKDKGKYHIEISQFSRKDSLEGLRNLRFYIEEIKK